jgi:hypothetical protein
MATAAAATPLVTTSFDAVLAFAKLHRDQFVALVDSIQDEPVPIQIKETWKKKDSAPRDAFCEYIATRIRAEAGLPDRVKDKLIELIHPSLVEDLLKGLRPSHGSEEKAIRKIRIHKVTGEGFLLLDSAESSAEVDREFHVFKLVIGKRKDFNDDKIFKFKLDGTMYRRTLDQATYATLAPTFAAVQSP